MSHDDDTCPHLVRANLLEAENARLKAEVERLTVLQAETLSERNKAEAEVERLTAIVGADAIDREHGMCCDASAQVERLTKAGDEMASNLVNGGITVSGYALAEEWFKAKWHAAKEGKQS